MVPLAQIRTQSHSDNVDQDLRTALMNGKPEVRAVCSN